MKLSLKSRTKNSLDDSDRMIDALIDDNHVKDILLRSLSVPSSNPSVENGSSGNDET